MTTEDRTVLTAALNTLSAQERQVVMLHVTAGLKHREIAQLLEMPLSTVALQIPPGLGEAETNPGRR